jgi:hypothetical protein
MEHYHENTIRGIEYVSPAILMERYGVTYLTLRSWTNMPEPLRIGRRLYYDREAVEDRILSRVK